MIKKIIPAQLKLRIKLLIAWFSDLNKGYLFNYAQILATQPNYLYKFNIQQDLKPNDAKLHNLSKAITRINAVTVAPNQIFSFWKIVGNPSEKNGYVESRSIVDGKVMKSVGGGLCQLSGLIYYISLYTNLDVLERHNHSIDIYTEETRFTPLGSDATVAFGYKDLKIRNNSNESLQFSIKVLGGLIEISCLHNAPIEYNSVEFKKLDSSSNKIEVLTHLNQVPIVKSAYKRKLFE